MLKLYNISKNKVFIKKVSFVCIFHIIYNNKLHKLSNKFQYELKWENKLNMLHNEFLWQGNYKINHKKQTNKQLKTSDKIKPR